jgi:uncharacterized protein YukE
MMNVKSELDQAISQLRALSASLGRTVAELDADGVWSGSDADTFRSNWADQVQRELTAASAVLDSISYAPAS